jgi:DNA-binding phage protein
LDIYWDDDIESHIATHGLSYADIEHVICHPIGEDQSESSGRPIRFGYAMDRRRLRSSMRWSTTLRFTPSRHTKLMAKITSHPKLTPSKLAELRAAAGQVDLTEKDAIVDKARDHFARRERIVALLAAIQRARQAKGMTLDDVARTTGIGKANLSRIFNADDANPTLDTTMRIADAVGYPLFGR